MVRHMQEDPAGFLQHAVCVNRELDFMLSIAWGRSVRLYPGLNDVEALLSPEGELDSSKYPAKEISEQIDYASGRLLFVVDVSSLRQRVALPRHRLVIIGGTTVDP